TFTPSTTGNLSITAIFGKESKTINIQVGSDTVIGDLNGDNKVTSLDALMALQMSVGLIPVDMRADVNRDNKVTSVDALMILQASVGLVELGV
ncbi:MAG: dockerin type I repeat-containing protein, partial [Methanosarcinales archaeon]